MSRFDEPQPDIREAPAITLTDLSDLVDRIRREDPSAMEELYRIFSRGIRLFLRRQLGFQELEDKVHDTFLIVVQAIQRGDLREPERLMGFVRTVVRRQVAASIETAVHTRRDVQEVNEDTALADRNQNPEESVIARQRADIMLAVLRSISKRDREVLTRFYLMEQTQDQICEEMALSETQFRLLKSRAKARFGVLGRRELERRPLKRLFLRKAAGSPH